jgi:hypothetical protein
MSRKGEPTVVDLSPYVDSNTFYVPENTAMARWLTGQPQNVWVALAPNLNWDFAFPTMRWMVNQPQCDLAVAATFFWMSELLRDPYGWNLPLFAKCDEKDMVLEVAHNAASGLYKSAEFTPVAEDVSETALAQIDWELSIPNIPKILYGPFGIREPVLPAEADPRQNPMVAKLFEGLGTGFL